MNIAQLKQVVITALDDIKAIDVQILDVTAMTDVTDFMVIASGQSTRQVKALTAEVVKQVKAAGQPPIGVEGEAVGEWALVDLGDIIVHIMTPAMRETYHLEKLWQVPAKTDDRQLTRDE